MDLGGCINKMVEFIQAGSIMEELMVKEPLFSLTVLFTKESFIKIRLTAKMENISQMR